MLSTLLVDAEAGTIRLITAEMVLAEIVWVLESVYDLKPIEIAPLIRGILVTPGLEVLNGTLISRALGWYETMNVDFIDTYIVAVMEKQGTEVSKKYKFL